MRAGVRRRQLVVGGVLGSALAARMGAAFGQAPYPDKPIKLIVPFPPGALTDNLGRLVANKLAPVLGQPIVVENRPGAGTLLGAAVVAKSAPDGLTLMVATTTTLAISPSMFAQPAAVTADFVGVAMIGSVSLLLVARPDLGVKSLPELVTLLRAAPGKHNFASPGNGTMHHLLIEMLKVQEKLQVTHVPYQGSGTAVTDLLAGRMDFMLLDAVAALPQIQAGKLRVLAVAAARRMPALPDVPTIAETYPALDMQAWQSIAAPRGTPAAVVARLNSEINRILEAADTREQLLKVGVEANPMSLGALQELIARDEKRFGDLVRALGLKAS